MALNTQQQMLVEQRVANEAKSIGVAYLLAIFVGGLGIHRFYLGRSGSGAAMLILLILGVMTVAFVIGAIPLLVVGVWAIVDLFLIPGMVAAQKEATRRSITTELEARAPEQV